MTKVIITMEVDDECADPGDSTGLTEEAHTEISTFLSGYASTFEIEKG